MATGMSIQLGLRSKLNSTLETGKIYFWVPASVRKAARNTLPGNASTCSDIVSAHVSIKCICTARRSSREGGQLEPAWVALGLGERGSCGSCGACYLSESRKMKLIKTI